MTSSNIIVVDGANVAYEELSKSGEPKVSNLIAMRRLLESKGYDPVIIVDATLRHKVDDKPQLEALIDDNVVRQAPAETAADYFILKFADQEHAQVISNDEYGEYQKQYPWIEERRVPFMIVNGKVELYEKKLKAAR